MKIANLEVYGIIYKIRNKINNKIYIGQTTLKFNKRYSGGRWNEKTNNQHLKNACKKYGIENFEVNKEFDIAYSKEELDKKEIYWINYYNSVNPKFGYNKLTGGSNGKHTEETRKKLSKSHIGHTLSDYTKLKLSISKKGHKVTYQTRQKISNSRKGKYIGENSPWFGRKHTEEEKRKISENHAHINGENHNNARKVICITTGEIFACMKYGANKYEIKNSTDIGACCRGKQKSTGKLRDGTKLVWMYYDEYIKQNQLLIHNESLGQAI